MTMTIPDVIMHNGQQMYFFDGLVEGPAGVMAKFSCAYCGTGDYVMSRVPSVYDLAFDAEDAVWSDAADEFETTIPGPQCCTTIPEQIPAPVPEPATFLMLLAALVLAALAVTAMRNGRYRLLSKH